MHDNPEPTEEEQEQAPEHVPEQEAMGAPGQDDPERTGEEDDDA